MKLQHNIYSTKCNTLVETKSANVHTNLMFMTLANWQVYQSNLPQHNQAISRVSVKQISKSNVNQTWRTNDKKKEKNFMKCAYIKGFT